MATPPADPDDASARTQIERAIAAIEGQRQILGDAAADAALAGLRAQLEATRAPVTGERRAVLTVLFADLEGFTEISRALDPEDVRDVVGRCFTAWRDAVQAHGGVVEKYIGDAVMAVFGLHRSDEEDAVSAIRAGRAMVAALAPIADDVEARHGVRLHMRVGIDTGEVVVSTLDDRGGQGFVAVGPTVNRASRLQGAAPRDTVLISEATRRHARGRFGLDPRGALVLKGIDEPVTAYVALGERPAGFDLEPAAGVGGVEVETVGRELELLALQEHLADVVEESSWRVVTVVGEAGIGKSRLLRELDGWLAERPEAFWWLRGRAAPSTRHRPHGVIRDLVATRFRITPQDSPATVLERAVAGLEAASGPSIRTDADAALLTRWLGFESAEAGERAPDPQTLNAEASTMLARYVATLAEHAPVVILLEDLHWADDASLGWVDAAHPVLQDRPVLVVATARPSFLLERPHWGEGLPHHARLDLEPLSRRHSRTLLRQLLGDVTDLPAEMSDMLVEQAEGNPYYLEELVAWLVDGGALRRTEDSWELHADRLEALRVPSTLQGLLQARLDTLPHRHRSVLQRAAVVGRVFWEDAVSRLSSDGTADDVAAALEALRSQGLVQQRATSGFEGTTEYLFKHAMLRDVAYESQLRSQRRERHAQVADWLVEVTRRSGRTDELAALVALHLDRAERPDAASWYLRAGTQAAAVFAVGEAKELLARGLQLANPDDAELRLDLLLADESVADREGDRDRQRRDHEAMSRLVEDVSEERQVEHLLACARFAQAICAYDETVRWAEQAKTAATSAGLVAQRARAHLWAGKAFTWMASSEAAHRELDTAVALAHEHGEALIEADATRYLAMLVTNESDFSRGLELAERARALFASESDLEGEGTALAQLSTTSYYLGHLEEARTYLEQALPMFERSGRRYAKTVALSNVGSIAAAQGRLALAMRSVQEAVAPSAQMEDREGSAINFLMIAEIELQLGRWSDVLEHVAQSEEIASQVATDALRSTTRSLRAQALSALGRHAEARELVAGAVDAARNGTMAREEAAAHMAQGYVLVGAGDIPPALDSFERAHALYLDLGIEGYAREALAGVADCQRRLGQHEQALETVEPLLDHLGEADLAGAQADHARLAVRRVLRDAGDERAEVVAGAAAGQLRARAALIGDDGMAAEFLARPVAVALLAP